MFAIGRILGTGLAAVAFGGTALAQDAAYETRIGEKGFESPPATLEQVDWLIGQWSGTGIGGAPAMESWLPPTGPTMVGTFVQETAEGEIQFTEHLYLMEEEGTLVLRLKHFNADLTGWEEKDDMLTFRLVAIEPCAAYFNALTLRCRNPNFPDSGIVAAVRMKSGEELVFRFNAFGPEHPARCPDAMTTFAMNECYADILERADARRKSYFAAAIERETDSAKDLAQTQGRNTPDLAAIDLMRSSEASFEAYREAECGAVWETWKTGTIRTVMSLGCSIGLTDHRTRTIWQNWLTHMDSTPPVLPEPKPTR